MELSRALLPLEAATAPLAVVEEWIKLDIVLHAI